ncbi:tRNA modification GTPase MnmE [Labeo rohita]|uniref:tRNA modification GTPase MnmE n=1 Tax=Labeo rohita TaxID=84645 RepID=A0ABQ8L2D2_LABRO|nr:tRNA modification GTPase MnmE [Labeo rohita]
MKVTHGGAVGGRSHGGEKADDSRGPTNSGGAGGRGALGGDGKPMSQGDAEDPEGQGPRPSDDQGEVRVNELELKGQGSPAELVDMLERRELGAMVEPVGRRAKAESASHNEKGL